MKIKPARDEDVQSEHFRYTIRGPEVLVDPGVVNLKSGMKIKPAHAEDVQSEHIQSVCSKRLSSAQRRPTAAQRPSAPGQTRARRDRFPKTLLYAA